LHKKILKEVEYFYTKTKHQAIKPGVLLAFGIGILQILRKEGLSEFCENFKNSINILSH
jgi:hypothetical protein